MQVSDEFELKCPQDTVFEFVSTPEKLVQCIPGCSELQDLGDNRYGAILAVDVAFLKLKFDVTVVLTQVHLPRQIKAEMDGIPKGLAGRLSGSVTLDLCAVDRERTNVHYLLEQSMTGRLGSIGQSVFRAKCEEMGGLFAENLRLALADG